MVEQFWIIATASRGQAHGFWTTSIDQIPGIPRAAEPKALEFGPVDRRDDAGDDVGVWKPGKEWPRYGREQLWGQGTLSEHSLGPICEEVQVELLDVA